MKKICNTEFGGERPLYCEKNLRLENVTIHLGESSLKETSNIEAEGCRFEGKYVFWETKGFKVNNSFFAVSARSSLWYSKDARLTNCMVEAPKMFRRTKGIYLENVEMPNAEETLWDCDDIEIKNCKIQNADYLFMHSNNIKISDYHQDGNYSFQYSKNVEIHNAVLNSKDSFWDSENCTIYDSEINGEYLGWYSKNLKLVRCHITGTQPLCYCENLIMEDCTLGEDADLAFEYSTIHATIKGNVVSIKNPTSGNISVESVGEIIIDENQRMPKDCIITCDRDTCPSPRS